MPYRLIGEVSDRPVELFLAPGRHLLGSGRDCDLRLDHPSISRHHAEIAVSEAGVEVHDLASRNGTWSGSQRITRGWVEAGAGLVFGQLEVRLLELEEADVEMGLAVEPSARPTPTTHEPIHEITTARMSPFDRFTGERLPGLLRRLRHNGDLSRVAQEVGAALFETLPILNLEIRADSKGGDGILYYAAQPAPPPTDSVQMVQAEGEVVLNVTLPRPALVDTLRPLIESAAILVALAAGKNSQWKSERPASDEPLAAVPPGPAPIASEVKLLYEEAARYARADISVLILGPSGTGKEVLARYIHHASARAANPFVALNCAALPRDLLEAELFGIEKGVATGVAERPGKFELASGGTLLLDEIGDMALETQAMILRVLQEGELSRIGSHEPRQVDVRILAATNQDIRELIRKGRFREDLYYRIAAWVAHLPALCHRKPDIPNLATHFLARAAERHRKSVRGISRAALRALVTYHWPGNIRQLEQEIDRAVLFVSDQGLLDTTRLSPELLAEPIEAPDTPLTERLKRFERQQILLDLRRFDGDIETTAKALGMSRSTFYRRMKELEIDPRDAPRPATR